MGKWGSTAAFILSALALLLIPSSLADVSIISPENSTYQYFDVSLTYTTNDSQCTVELDRVNMSYPACDNTTLTYVHYPDAAKVLAFDFKGSGNVTTDRSTYRNNGNLSASIWTTAGRYGIGIAFNGSTQIDVGDKDYFSPIANNMTIIVWARIPSSTPASGNGACGSTGRYFITKGIASNWEWALENDNNNLLCFSMWTLAGGAYGSVSQARTLNDDTWHMYAVTINYSSNLSMYVDGILVGSTSTFTSSMGNGNQGVQIGRRGDGNFFNGGIDEVAIYNRSMSTAEIQNLYSEHAFAGQHNITVWSNSSGGWKSAAGNFTVQPTALDLILNYSNASTLAVAPLTSIPLIITDVASNCTIYVQRPDGRTDVFNGTISAGLCTAAYAPSFFGGTYVINATTNGSWTATKNLTVSTAGPVVIANFTANATTYFIGDTLNLSWKLTDGSGNPYRGFRNVTTDWNPYSQSNEFGMYPQTLEIRREIVNVGTDGTVTARVYVEFDSSSGCCAAYFRTGTWVSIGVHGKDGASEVPADIIIANGTVNAGTYVAQSLKNTSGNYTWTTNVTQDFYNAIRSTYLEFTIPPNRSLSDVVISVDAINMIYDSIWTDGILIGNMYALDTSLPGADNGTATYTNGTAFNNMRFPIYLPLIPGSTGSISYAYMAPGYKQLSSGLLPDANGSYSDLLSMNDYFAGNISAYLYADAWGASHDLKGPVNITFQNPHEGANITIQDFGVNSSTYFPGDMLLFSWKLNETQGGALANFTSRTGDPNIDMSIGDIGFGPQSLEVRRQIVSISPSGTVTARVYVEFDAYGNSYTYFYPGTRVNISVHGRDGVSAVPADITVTNGTSNPGTYLAQSFINAGGRYYFSASVSQTFSAGARGAYLEFTIPPNRSLSDIVFSVDYLRMTYDPSGPNRIYIGDTYITEAQFPDTDGVSDINDGNVEFTTGTVFGNAGSFPLYLPLDPNGNGIVYGFASPLHAVVTNNLTAYSNGSYTDGLYWGSSIMTNYTVCLYADKWGYTHDFRKINISFDTSRSNTLIIGPVLANSTYYAPNLSVRFNTSVNDSSGPLAQLSAGDYNPDMSIGDIGFGPQSLEVRRQIVGISPSGTVTARVYVEFDSYGNTFGYFNPGTLVSISVHGRDGISAVPADITVTNGTSNPGTYLAQSFINAGGTYYFNASVVQSYYGGARSNYLEFTIPPNRSLSDIVFSVDYLRMAYDPNGPNRIYIGDTYITEAQFPDTDGDGNTNEGSFEYTTGMQFGTLGSFPLHLPLAPGNGALMLKAVSSNYGEPANDTFNSTGGNYSVVHRWASDTSEQFSVRFCANKWGYSNDSWVCASALTLDRPRPAIVSISDNTTSTKPANINDSVGFAINWSLAAEPSEVARVFVCNTSQITSAGCLDKMFCSTGFSASHSLSCTYTAEENLSMRQAYYIMVCTDSGSCSDVSAKNTFYANTSKVPPIISANYTSAVPYYGAIVAIIANASDFDGNLATVSFTVTAPNGTAIIAGTNGTQNGDLWTSPTFTLDQAGRWNFSIIALDSTGGNDTSSGQIRFLDIGESIPSHADVNSIITITGSLNASNGTPLAYVPILFYINGSSPHSRYSEGASAWQYMRRVNITEMSGSNLTNYQVNITLDTASLIAAGKMIPTCADVRVTDTQTRLLSYWVESCNAANTTIWVKMNLTANSSTAAHLYYGSRSAQSRSNISTTFLFGDDFDGPALAQNWTEVTKAGALVGTFSNGSWTKACTAACDWWSTADLAAAIYTPSPQADGSDIAWEAVTRMSREEGPANSQAGMMLYQGVRNGWLWARNNGDSTSNLALTGTTYAVVSSVAPPLLMKIRKETANGVGSSNNYTFWLNNGTSWNVVAYNATTIMSSVGIYNKMWQSGLANSTFDYFYIKKYVVNGPVSLVGTEEVQSAVTDTNGNYGVNFTTPSVGGTYTVLVNATAGDEYGQMAQNIAIYQYPTINSNGTNQTPHFNASIVIIANVTDDNIASVNFTLIAPNGTIIIGNINGTRNGDLWTSQAFTLSSAGRWNYTIIATDNDGNSGVSNGSIAFIFLAASLSPSRVDRNRQFNISIAATDEQGRPFAQRIMTIYINGTPLCLFGELCDWGFRRRITVNASQVSGTLTDFPTVVRIASDPDLAAKAKSNGDDLLFTDENGAKLAHEIEHYNSTTGQLVAWVRIPRLSNDTNTSIYLYYGNPLSARQENRTGTWPSFYRGVWHLHGNPSGAAIDSTGNGNNATSFGMNSTHQVSGALDGAHLFEGDAHETYMNVQNNSGIDNVILQGMTLEAWINTRAFNTAPLTSSQRFMGRTNGTSGWWWQVMDQAIFAEGTYQTIRFSVWDDAGGYNSWQMPNYAIGAGSWYSTALYYNASWLIAGTPPKFYLNGTSISDFPFFQQGPTGKNLSVDSGTVRLGGYPGSTQNWDGMLDELRISVGERPANWIRTEYNNQMEDSTFLTVAAEERYLVTDDNGQLNVTLIAPNTSGSYMIVINTTDGTLYGETALDLTVMQYPRINSNAANQTPYYNATITLVANVTDDNLESVNFTLVAPNGTVMIGNVNGTRAGDLWVSQAFALSSVGRWNYTIVALDSDGNNATATGQVRFLDISETLAPERVDLNANVAVNGSIRDSGGSPVANTLVGVYLGGVRQPSLWWDDSWRYRTPITINGSQVRGTLADFPVLVRITDADLITKAQANGSDIVFANASGAKLDYEVESYSSATGQLIAWVRLPALSNATDTTFYLYYGNEAAQSQQNGTGVWDASYYGVWHSGETSGTVLYESTARRNNGTKVSATEPLPVAGAISGAQKYDASNDFVSAATLNIPSTVTMSAWVNSSNYNQNGFIIQKAPVNTQWELFFEGGSVVLRGGSTTSVTCGLPANNEWHYMTGTINGTNGTIFIDGAQCKSSTVTAIGNGAGNIEIGRHNSGYYFNGIIDEVRVSNTSRSGPWIATEYDNQKAGSSFLSLGAEEFVTNQSGEYVLNITAPGVPGSYPVFVNASYNGEYGQAVRNLVVMQYPKINSNATNQTPYYNATITIIANVTDDNIANVNFTIIAPNGTTIISNINGSRDGNLWTGQAFTLSSAGRWNYTITATDSDGNNDTSNGQIRFLDISALLTSSRININTTLGVRGGVNDSNGQPAAGVPVWFFFNLTPASTGLYQVPITITENSGTSLQGYEVNLSMDTVTPVAQGKMNANCSDLRLVDAAGASLPYWIESGCNTSITKVWVKANLTANANTTVYARYGSKNSTSGADARATFELFDDFESGSINTTYWNASGSVAPYWTTFNNTAYEGNCSSGNVRIGGGQQVGINKSVTLPTSGVLEFYWAVSSEGCCDFLFYCINNAACNKGTGYAQRIGGAVGWTYVNQSLSPGSNSITFGYGKDGTVDAGNDTGLIDFVRVRQKTSIDPSTTLGAEQSLGETNASGGYGYNVSSPAAPGTYTLLVNASYNGEYGQATQNLVVMQYPKINSNGTNQSAYYNATITLIANVTDDNIASVNFTLIAPNGTVMLNNAAGTHTAGDLWTGQEFTLSGVGQWNYTITAIDTDGNNDTSQGNIRFLHISETLAPARAAIGTAVSVAGSINDSGGSPATNVTVRTYLNGTLVHVAGWYSGWAYRKNVTFNSSQINGTFTNFPVLINTPADASLATRVQANGNDILFVSSNGARLDHEIEEYNSTTGKLVVWVRIPVLSNASDTTIYLYYGNPAAANQQNPPGVWDSTYRGVWHLAANAKDSTLRNNGTFNGGVQNATGAIGGAMYVDGSTGYIDIGTDQSLNITKNITLEAWINPAALNNYGSVIGVSTWAWNAPAYQSYAMQTASDGSLTASFNWNAAGATSVNSNVKMTTGNWYKAVVTYNGTHISEFLNGQLAGTPTAWAGPIAAKDLAHHGYMGNDPPGGMEYYKGTIEEVRISSSAHSFGWVQTEYNNQRNGSTFTTISEEEMVTDQSGGYNFTITAPATSGTYQVLVNATYNGEYGQTAQTLVVMQYPKINSNATNQSAYYNATVTIVANVTDDNLASVNFTLVAPNGTVMLNNAAGTHTIGDLWTSQAFTLSSVGRWNYTIIALDSDGNNATTTGQIRFLDISAMLAPTRAAAGASVAVTGRVDQSSGGPVQNTLAFLFLNSTTYNGTAYAPSGWYGAQWSYRKNLTINASQVNGTLTDFPVLVNLASDPDLAATVQSSGNDILFTNSSGAKLDHEIELYNSATGQLVAWVRIPVLSNASDTTIYLYYGNPVAADQQNITGVWDRNYMGVWHMKEASGPVNDSTINNNTARIIGNVTLRANGAIGYAAMFDGSGYLNVTSSPSLAITGDMSVEVWGNFTDYSNYRVILGKTLSNAIPAPYDFYAYSSTGLPRLERGNGAFYSSSQGSAAPMTGKWQHIAFAMAGTTVTHYLNGSGNGGGPLINTIADSGTSLNIGARANGNMPMKGSLDEVRISNVSRPLQWVQTEYNNQGSTFLKVNTQESAPMLTNATGDYALNITAPMTQGTYQVLVNMSYNGEYGQAMQTLVVMQYPRINSNGTNQSAYYNATVTIVANVTDDNLASVNFTLIASNGTVMLNNAAGTHTTGDLWTSQAFTLSSAGRWNYTIVAMDNDGNNDTASGQIRFLDISGTLTPARVSVKSAVIVSGQINDSSGAAAANASVGVCLNGVQQPSSWWNFTWRYRAAITINGTQVSGTLTDFPILVRITDADLVKAQASGNDIAFSNASGAKLDHEIEYYNSTSGELVAWVRMPVLSNLSDTTIYLYYGNPAAADQQNRTGVWNANLKGVWHLANGTILSGKDATAYGNDGSINAVTAATGYIDGAGNFTGSYVSVPENDALDPSSITLSAWARITASPTNFGNIVSKGDNSGYRFRIDNARTVTFMDRGGANSLGTTKTVTVGNWTFIVVSGNSSGLRIYLDGALNASNAVAYGSPNTTSAFKIGVGLSEYFNGLIDEVRIWNSSQSPAWISTEYNNQKAGSTFLSLGTEEISTNQSGQYTLTITAPATAGNYSVVVNATYNGEYGQATQMLEVTSDSCTPTPGQPWVLDLGDNCTISLVSIDVPSWTITGTKDGTVTIQDANIAYKNKTVGSIAGRGQIVYLGNVTIRAG